MPLTLIALHLLATAVVALVARRAGRWVFALGAVPPAVTLLWAAMQAPAVLAGGAVTAQLGWAPAAGLALDVRVDGFALLMVALVSGVGVLVFAYSAWYFPPNPGLGRFTAALVAFAGAMLGVVLVDNLLALYVFWELTTITSYLLIGYEDEQESARAAALTGLLTTAAGGLAMLGGFVLLAEAAGTYSLSALLAAPPSGTAVTAGALLVLLGAFTKSAQVPFHYWLAAAMQAPTPVSAYLHSAAMVKAGVYLVARLAPVLAAITAGWRPLVVGVGVATTLVGAARRFANTT